ncbi:MAG: hypothetical protein CMK32_09620 [Porticoccaceae bacterium]|nr:hypothetical protein [Porticoccaceae bacterium]
MFVLFAVVLNANLTTTHALIYSLIGELRNALIVTFLGQRTLSRGKDAQNVDVILQLNTRYMKFLILYETRRYHYGLTSSTRSPKNESDKLP